jgi:IrrE N-terminal-like domain
VLRRGFKAQSERRSIELRKQLDLSQDAPLSADRLAHHLSVRVLSARNVEGVQPSDLHQLTVTDADCWSAFTLRIGPAYLVVYNPAQSKRRINSVVMHELAHILLGHELVGVQTTSDGHLTPSHYNQDQEDEADWLGSALLLPRPALLLIRHRRWDDERACDYFSVSGDMLRWRFRMTGVDHQIQNYARR